MFESLIARIYGMLAVLPFDFLQYGFMQRAVFAAFFLAIVCALLGVLVVQFRMAFFSDAVAHSSFTGIALGMLLGIDPWLSLLVFGMAMGMLAVRVRRKADLAMDTTLGVLFSGTIALGLAIISARKELARVLPGFLYGDILTLTDRDLLWIMALSLGEVGFILRYFNQLLYISLHDHLARVAGVRVSELEMAFAAALALLVGFAIKVVGILLVTALLVIPATTARNLAATIRGQVWLAMGLALAASFAGLATSLRLDTAPGAAIILWSTLFFVLSLFFSVRGAGGGVSGNRQR